MEDVIKQCQRGDIAAFKKLYDAYHQPMLRVAVRMLGRQQDAEDAVQTAFIKLYHGIKNFSFRSAFSTYLFRILTNVCFDAIRRQKKHQTDDLDCVTIKVEPQTDIKIQLEHAIAHLPERMRLCFVLFAVEEFKIDEIAEIMNLSAGGVKSTLYQARVRLRTMLSDD